MKTIITGNEPKMRLEEELLTAVSLAAKAGEAVMDIYFGKSRMEVEHKKDGTPVTNADYLSNRIIVEGLRERFPRDGIISEELADVLAQGWERRWYIDPIDGTKGFAGHSDQFAIHIGLAEREEPVMGLVYKPTTKEYYWAVRGEGAYRHAPAGIDARLPVVNPETAEGRIALITNTSFLQKDYGIKLIRELNPGRVLTSGSEGLRIARVAEGIANLHLLENHHGCNTWDLCAPQIIAEEAGAYMAYLDGSRITYNGQRKIEKSFIVASDRKLFEKAKDYLIQAGITE